MTSRDLHFELALPVAPEKVWRALAIPEFRAAWLLPEADGVLDGRGAGLSEAIRTEVLSAEAPHRLTLAWREDCKGERLDSVVTFELEDTSQGGTILRLTHSNLVSVPQPANENAPVTAMRRAA